VRGAFGEITKREWALLALETLGVIAGILIAFELNEWASRRNEAAKHDRLMARLHEEVEIDVTVLRSFRDLLKDFVDREQAFAVALAKGQCPPVRDFEAVGTVGLAPALTVPTMVYEELLGAGGLSTIVRLDVRQKVAQFYGNLAWAQQQVDHFRANKVKPTEIDDPRVRIHFDPTAEEPEIATFDGQALCAEQGFKNRMASATRNHTVFLSYFQESLEDAIDLCVRLGDSLGKTCNPPAGGPLKGEDAKYAAEVLKNMRLDKAEQASR
jgi:hypothetical protein